MALHSSLASILAFILFVSSTSNVSAWVSQSTASASFRSTSASNFCSISSSTSLYEEKNVKASEYGVSYIGGDPCGSKYNDDPFDKQITKPGFPDDMKARIEALAEKKRLENENKKKDD